MQCSMANVSAIQSWTCDMCGFVSPSLKQHISHLRMVHRKDTSFSAKCGIDSCTSTFKSFGGFSSHVYRMHRRALGLCQEEESFGTDDDPHSSTPLMGTATSLTDIVTGEGSCNQDASSSFDPGGSFHSDHLQLEVHSTKTDLQKLIAKLLLRLSEGHGVSEVAIQTLINGFQSCIGEIMAEALQTIEYSMLQHGLEEKLIEEVLSEVRSIGANPFEGLTTSYFRYKYFKETFEYIEPREISWGNPYYIERFHGSKRQKVLKTDKFYYVPLLKTLGMLLNQPSFANEIFSPRLSKGKISDFCDSEIFKEHSLFSTDPHALQIVAYYDELEVCNSIGSYVKTHKLGCLFFTLGNIRPRYRSTLKTIFVLAIGRYENIQEYGIDSFLAPFVEDLKVLYLDGISHNGTMVYGALLAFLADNLAAHLVAGFKQSYSFALRICRSCMVTPPLLQTCLNEDKCHLRTPEEHEEICQLLESPLASHYSVTYGVNRRSILENVPGFSVIRGLPHDMMHDLLEGVVPFELKLFLQYCTSSKLFTIDELNDRIQKFDFIDNKPSVIDPKIANPVQNVSIHQSASQMMTLILDLPFLICDLIPEDDQNWQSIIMLIKICKIAFAPSCTPDVVPVLALLVQEKLEAFKLLYPHASLKPKHHYMVHYPSQIALYGPLIRSWCMRNESKLSFIKRASRRSNFKNVCKTTIEKHQLWLCFQIMNNEDENFFGPDITTSTKPRLTPFEHEPEHVRSQLRQALSGSELQSDAAVCRHKWACVSSTTFRPGNFFLLQYDELDPVFGKVVEVLTLSNVKALVLVVSIYVCNYFNTHIQAYSVKATGSIRYINSEDLAHFQELSAHHNFIPTDKNLYISIPCLYY